MSLYPYAREAVDELIHGNEFAGYAVRACYRLEMDSLLPENLPVAVISQTGGTEGYVDRVDRVEVVVYAIGTEGLTVAEAIRSNLVGRPHDTSVGFVDDIVVETVPVDLPYPDPKYTQTQTVYRVTTRPIQ